MAHITIRQRSKLATSYVLAPERYDPRRELDAGAAKSVILRDLVTAVRDVVQPSGDLGRCLVLDTSDAREGIVTARKKPIHGSEIGSAKKVVEPNDVIISRLRPYLRQVAFVDEDIPNSEEATLACSTEFFVLRSPDRQSIAFLVPFLLSPPVQEVLAAAQEGGHHPRVNESTLLSLPVPIPFLDQREMISKTIEKSVELYRKAERGIDETVAAAESSFS